MTEKASNVPQADSGQAESSPVDPAQAAAANDGRPGQHRIERKSIRRTLSCRKRWAFRSLTVVLSLLGLSLVELLLRVSGVGDDLSLVIPVPHARDILRYQINPDADRVWCPGQGMAGPEPRRFDLPRPTGVFRIVVVGASTVQGFPYASELAFPRQLEVLLNLQQSRTKVEVLNLGVTGVSTTVVREFVSESLSLQPDLIIVHAGHNEFYGIGGVASTVGTAPHILFKTAESARRTRLGQTLARLLPTGIPDDQDPIEVLPADLEIRLTSDLVAAAEVAFRRNLQAMVATTRDAGIPIVLSTVAANCRSHSPVSGFLPDRLTDTELSQWRNAFDEGRRLAADQQSAAALMQFELALRISEESSLLQYRRAECLLTLGRVAEADQAFRLAADLDGCRFRAPSSFSRIVSDVAADANDGNVVFVDTGEAIRQAVTQSTQTASELPVFLEHVHYSRRGHGILAETLARPLLKQFLNASWDDSIAVDSPEFSNRLGVLAEDDLAALTFALEIYNREPMRRAFDAQRHQQTILQAISSRFAGLTAEAQDDFSALTMEQMGDDLPMYLADRIERTGNRDRLLNVLRKAVLRQPWSAARCQRLLHALRSGAALLPAELTELKLQTRHCHEISTEQESL
ncbi:hypothetical protein GC176_15610 [bacterium]|nr:hypothetical protein [bacterium]